MKKIFLSIIFCTLSFQIVASESNQQIDKAIGEYYNDNKSSAIRRLQVLVDNEPENYKARWLLIHFSVLNFDTSDMYLISQTHEEVEYLKDLAIKNKNKAYAHYIASIYARNHRAYDIATKEIDNALKIEPQSILYNWVKAALLVRIGKWEKNNDLIYKGIDYYHKANKLADKKYPPFFSEVDYHFKVGWSLNQLSGSESCPAEAIDHYIAVTELSKEENKTLAYAWNNISCMYRKLGQCEKAKQASINALNIMKFGAAKTNLQYSEFCIQMQNMNLWSTAKK